MIQILGRVRVQELPAFISVFSTRGAMMRRKHGSRSAQLFKAVESGDEVVLLFEWESREAFEGFLSDPLVKETMKSSGIKAPPEFQFLEKVAEFPG